jgi:hypothetical protein
MAQASRSSRDGSIMIVLRAFRFFFASSAEQLFNDL